MLSNNMQISGTPGKTYADDVFAAYPYVGTAASLNIPNGIDLLGRGGMVWVKNRDVSLGGNHVMFDSMRDGVSNELYPNLTNAESGVAGSMASFNANGFTLSNAGDLVRYNSSSVNYASWTFRKAPKFFDMVTYVGSGANRTIPHNLGVAPGMIIVKRTNSTGSWAVYHRSIANTEFLVLNGTAAKSTGATVWNSTSATDTTFSIGTHGDVNSSAGTYIAYLFAHDTDTTDGLIQCGVLTTDGSGGASVTLGWEPQFLIVKGSDTTGGWFMMDTMRAMTKGLDRYVYANDTAIESSVSDLGDPNATGFVIKSATASKSYVYIAVRRPNKPPLLGTQVYNAIARTGTGATATVTGVGFPLDLSITKKRSSTNLTGARFVDRLRGAAIHLDSTATSAEVTTADTVSDLDVMDGFALGADASIFAFNKSAHTHIHYFFKRAPGVFDMICYTGTGSNKTETHSLGVVPELWIVKGRSGSADWQVGSIYLTQLEKMVLNTTAGRATDATAWNSTFPTASVINLGTQVAVNSNTATYVAYLFATKPGISKVGLYSGDGGTQTIDCWFPNAARFVMIKRIDSTGDWYVWDSTRGMTDGGNDAHVSFNTTAAEDASDNGIDPCGNGFRVVQNATTNINVSAAQYLFLAIA